MKRLNHVWRYLTSPMYRAHVDIQMSQQALDAHVAMMRENLRRSSLPPLLTKYMDTYGIENPEVADKLIRAEYGIKKY